MKSAYKLVCVGSNEVDADALRIRLESSYLGESAVLSTTRAIDFLARSSQQVLSYSNPDLIVVAASFEEEAAYAFCRDARLKFESCPIILLSSAETLSLERMRFFSSVTDKVFFENEPTLRILFSILETIESISSVPQANLISVVGAKGGVGATTLCVAMAEAAHAMGLKTLVVDFSKAGVIPFYLKSERWDSIEYAHFLERAKAFDEKIFSQIVHKTSSGISLLLPPSGSQRLRERWLRDSTTFERSIDLLSQLREQYDVILVDHAGAEGVLPYALLHKSSQICLVTSNEASSVHLVGQVLGEFVDFMPTDSVSLVFNELRESGLKFRDLKDFVASYPLLKTRTRIEHLIPHDTGGKFWLAMGRGFYQQARSQTKIDIEGLLCSLMGKEFLGFERKMHSSRAFFWQLAALARLLLPSSRKARLEANSRLLLGSELTEL